MPGRTEAICAEIQRLRPIQGIRIIGVDGPSGSGKSTLAGELGTVLNAPVIETDDFVSWDCFDGWWPRFEDQVLEPLLAGKDAVFQARDWSDWHGSSLGAWKYQPWAPTVILEGVTCTRQATVGRLAYAVWVEAPAEIRLARGLERDAAFPEAPVLWRRWMKAEAAFFVEDRTRERANIRVSTG